MIIPYSVTRSWLSRGALIHCLKSVNEAGSERQIGWDGGKPTVCCYCYSLCGPQSTPGIAQFLFKIWLKTYFEVTNTFDLWIRPPVKYDHIVSPFCSWVMVLSNGQDWTRHSDLDLSQPNSNQFILQSKWTSVPNLKEGCRHIAFMGSTDRQKHNASGQGGTGKEDDRNKNERGKRTKDGPYK